MMKPDVWSLLVRQPRTLRKRSERTDLLGCDCNPLTGRGSAHKTMPKVSIIVPNYNHARFLPRRIESILRQSYQDFELILLDDCSTDDSRAKHMYHGCDLENTKA